MLIKVCSKLVHPQEIRYKSKSRPGHTYVVVTESLFNDDFCTCPGWKFRETCSHVDAAKHEVCKWHSEDLVIEKCPNCGGTVEEFETEAEWD